MISSNADLQFYLDADRLALGLKRSRPRLFGDDIWKYERILRRYEYALNCLRSPLFWPVRFYWRYRYYKYGIRLNFEIPPNVVGPGLSLAHRGPVIINPAARIGENCRIHSCVNIGAAAGTQRAAPTIGNDVYIGPGAKIVGPVTIADRIAIGAQAMVNRSFEQPGITIGGVPARVLSERGSTDYIIRGTELAAKAHAR